MKREQSKKYSGLQKLRIISQAGFFALFLILFIKTHYGGEDYLTTTVEGFFHFDPLLALATTIGSRLFFVAFWLSIITLLFTLIFGRAICGWICPLGAVHQFFSFVFKKTRWLKPKKDDHLSLAPKYIILIIVLAASIFAVNLAGYLDPLSFLYRSFAVYFTPLLNMAFSQSAGLTYSLGFESLGQTFGQTLGNLALNSYFQHALAIGLLLMAAILLNAWKERFWCRYLCPAGALLGLFSRFNVFKLKIDPEKCINCHLCSIQCQTNARPYPAGEWKSSECIYCETCAAICPTAAITFPVRWQAEKIQGVNLSRRKILLTSLTTLLVAPIFKITLHRQRAYPALIRPPGALPEEKFLNKCIKCGECLKVCPTNGLQPALTEAGPEGIWTPVLVPRIGYCEYYCSLCSQVCPTGAITELTIEEKTTVKIGTAFVDKNRCLPYTLGRQCLVCEEHCPVSPKAIQTITVETLTPEGKVATNLAPFVNVNNCIGCGICENKCVVVDEPAIRVSSIGEARSEKNRLLLQVNEPGDPQQ
ncbi:MAG: 4Fe-4S binding protein [Acidobacteriota bacterium]|nr:4Fe-4S binding protein [Acidobacteriota bacterium]